jgi:hypothetical protein
MHKSERAPVWLWLSLLSLDAPLVALVWQDFLARCYAVPLRPPTRVALGLTVWAIYVADRLLDVRHAPAGPETVRHGFYRRHRSLARGALCCILVADLVIALGWVRFAILEHALFIGLGTLFYLTAFPLAGLRHVAWKKVLAGLIFTAGVFLTAPSRTLIWQMGSFCALCLGNLFLVEGWERHQKPVIGGLCMTALFAVSLPGNSPWFHAVAASAAGLAGLAFLGEHLSVEASGVLADAVLLSPLLLRIGFAFSGGLQHRILMR